MSYLGQRYLFNSSFKSGDIFDLWILGAPDNFFEEYWLLKVDYKVCRDFKVKPPMLDFFQIERAILYLSWAPLIIFLEIFGNKRGGLSAAVSLLFFLLMKEPFARNPIKLKG